MAIFNLYNGTGLSQSYAVLLWFLPGIIIFGVAGYLVSIKLRINGKNRLLLTIAPAASFLILTILLSFDEIIFNSEWNREQLVMQDTTILKGLVTATRERKGRNLYEVLKIGNTTLWRIVPIYDKHLPGACYQDLVLHSDFNNKMVELRYIPLSLNEDAPTEISYCITYVAVL